MPSKSLKQLLSDGKTVLCAEGYLFELERRGYLKAGHFVPEVVLDNPKVVTALHEEFVHAGSDIVQALTYYGHREKLRHVNRENDLELFNRQALRLARDVANATGTLMAGNICNSAVYDKNPNCPKAIEEARQIFKEQVIWASQGGADMLIAETYAQPAEAMLALEIALKYGNGLPVVVNVLPFALDSNPKAVQQLLDAGATVAGLNCGFGPQTMMKSMTEVRKTTTGYLSCLPVPYRTTSDALSMQNLTMPDGSRAFFENLDAFYCSQSEIREFGKAAKNIGVQFLGICCGNSSRHFRALAESVGRVPPASKYSTDMSKHYILGNDPNVGGGVKDLAENLWKLKQ